MKHVGLDILINSLKAQVDVLEVKIKDIHKIATLKVCGLLRNFS